MLEDHNRDEDAQGSHGYATAPAASRAVPSHGGGGDGHGGHGEFDFSEVFVHQVRSVRSDHIAPGFADDSATLLVMCMGGRQCNR